MKKLLMFAVLFSGMILAWACNDKNNNPTAPVTIPGGTSTPTGTRTPDTPTYTPTLGVGVFTPTPTPTYSLPIPVFQNNYSTAASPRCMVLNGSLLTVAENEVTSQGAVADMAEYTVAGSSLSLGNPPNVGNIILIGAPPASTPGTPVAFQPTTITLQAPQGFVNPGGGASGAWSAVLDLNGAGATLYAGYYSSWTAQGLSSIYMPYYGSGYDGIAFNNPKGMCDDATHGLIYVADTGNGFVDEFSPYEGIPGAEPLWMHRWSGFAGVTVGGSGVTFGSAAVSFKSPYAVACDSTGNVWVGDPGYTPSYVSEYTSEATTILQSWQCIPGCVVHGLAVNPGTGNIYVADSGNHLVEVYSPTGTILTALSDPGPAAHEAFAFSPSCLAFGGGFIYVGDDKNDFIDVFQ